jgi:hypothetical protein
MSSAIHEKKRIPILKNDKKIAKKHDFREQKNVPKAKKSRFITKNDKNDDSWDKSSPFLVIPVTLQGIKNTGPAKYSFLSFFWPRQPWRPSWSAMFIAESPVSCQALILTFLVIKCFLQTSVVFWQDNF